MLKIKCKILKETLVFIISWRDFFLIYILPKQCKFLFLFLNLMASCMSRKSEQDNVSLP